MTAWKSAGSLQAGTPMYASVIESRRKDPLGNMLLDYHAGKSDASVVVESATLEMWEMTGARMCRTLEQMGAVERAALDLCCGRVVDAGAGSGCHSLILQEGELSVLATDISPGCVEVMHKRGVAEVCHRNIFEIALDDCDTLLMLMNGLGICGSLEGCNLFLESVAGVLRQSAQILVDSTDLSVFTGGEEYFDDGSYIGETEFVMRYGEAVSGPFDWLYVDFQRLERMADAAGFSCDKIVDGDEGGYLARLRRK